MKIHIDDVVDMLFDDRAFWNELGARLMTLDDQTFKDRILKESIYVDTIIDTLHNKDIEIKDITGSNHALNELYEHVTVFEKI